MLGAPMNDPYHVPMETPAPALVEDADGIEVDRSGDHGVVLGGTEGSFVRGFPEAESADGVRKAVHEMLEASTVKLEALRSRS